MKIFTITDLAKNFPKPTAIFDTKTIKFGEEKIVHARNLKPNELGIAVDIATKIIYDTNINKTDPFISLKENINEINNH